MKTIPLTQGLFTVVDDADFEALVQHKWYARKSGRRFYAARRRPASGGCIIYVHRVILRCPAGMQIDHKDGDGLNNTRENLRIVTCSENQRGRIRKPIGKSSQFRGVCWQRRDKKWWAQIKHSGRTIHIGRFENEIDAARAYDDKTRGLGWPPECRNFA